MKKKNYILGLLTAFCLLMGVFSDISPDYGIAIYMAYHFSWIVLALFFAHCGGWLKDDEER